MILWLPERIYNNIKNNPDYTSLIQSYDYLNQTEDLTQSINENISNTFGSIDTWLKNNLSGENRRLYEILTMELSPNNISNFRTLFNSETNIENKLFILYQIESCSVTFDDDYISTITEFISLVDSNPSLNFSERIFVKYFQYQATIFRSNLQKQKFTFEDFQKFLELLYKTKELVCNKFSNTEYIQNIINHKFIYEISMFLLYSLTPYVHEFSEEDLEKIHIQCEIFCLNDETNPVKFKYSEFSPYELDIYLTIFQHLLIISNLEKSKEIFSKIIARCNKMLIDKKLIIKASSHHNLGELPRLMLIMFTLNRIHSLLPNFYTDVINQSLLTNSEKVVIINGNTDNLIDKTVSKYLASEYEVITQVKLKFEI